MLALNDALLTKFIDIFIKRNAFILDDIRVKFIKYLHLPVAVSPHQNSIFDRPEVAKQQGSLFKIHKKTNNDELVETTTLKLMLVNKRTTTSFVTININDRLESIDVRYSATYKSSQNRDKAKQHIRNLLNSAQYIKVTDQFMTAGSSWKTIKNIIADLTPKKCININICANPQINGSQKNELKNLCTDWNVNGSQFDQSRMHDRYIETDKFEILLSSGLLYLEDDKKDFTYTIKIK